MNDDVLLWWAKLSRTKGDESFHPLICHLIDVATVAQVMWDEVLTARQRRWIANELGLSEVDVRAWVILAAGHHDLGKASNGFRRQETGAVPHGTVSAFILWERYQLAPYNLSEKVARYLAAIIGGHHGVFPDRATVEGVQYKRSSHAGLGTSELREALLGAVLTVSGIPAEPIAQIPTVAVLWLAGFISVVDWIGSNSEFFPFHCPDGRCPADFSLEDYRAYALGQARRALEQLGWFFNRSEIEPLDFAALFPHIAEPNDLQRKMEELARQQSGPWLAIVEAPMGEGKSEAAFFAADDGIARLGMAGAYVALPTQATSNQMFTRRHDYLRLRYPELPVQLQLLHGQSGLSDEFDELIENYESFLSDIQIEAQGEGPQQQTSPSVMASTWFTNRKRALLAGDGVGTVDQGLMAILGTKHVFVRLFGLAGKTVIIDEVHAYDTYMTSLLERLLQWLAALDCSVVLLSATLPAARREQLVCAYLGKHSGEMIELKTEAYPCITWASRDDQDAVSIETSERSKKQLAVEWIVGSDGWREALVDRLDADLPDGACAAIICNTVGNAQEMYLALRKRFDTDELDLLHARFQSEKRRCKEDRLLKDYGKPVSRSDSRPFTGRRVVVATQVIEQSLDLDFDLMVTQLAPVDLVLQRVGRLHRHERDHRPTALATPTLWIIGPPEEHGLPDFNNSFGWVYDRHVLERSWWVLRHRTRIAVPGDVVELIEAVYDDDLERLGAFPDTFRAPLDRSKETQRIQTELETKEAQKRWIKSPDDGGHPASLCSSELLEEDAPNLHTAFQALTRLAEPSIQAVLLPVRPDGTPIMPPNCRRFTPSSKPTAKEARELLKRAVKLNGKRRVYDLQSAFSIPKGWKESSLLSHTYLIPFDPVTKRPMFKDSDNPPRVFLELDDELGVLFDDLRTGAEGEED